MSNISKRQIWLDCDPGHDDAMAIILAAHSPVVDLLGVSTVACNQTVDKTTMNALAILHAINKQEIDVVKGAEKPLMKSEPPQCPSIHGNTGLDAPDGTPVFKQKHDKQALDRNAITHMYSVISKAYKESSQTVNLVATGALTNVAMLISVFPDIKDMIRVVIMGGSIGIGNIAPLAEYNIQTDPHAAHIVFNNNIDLTMVPLNVTHLALVTPKVLQLLLTVPLNTKTKGEGYVQHRNGACTEHIANGTNGMNSSNAMNTGNGGEARDKNGCQENGENGESGDTRRMNGVDGQQDCVIPNYQLGQNMACSQCGTSGSGGRSLGHSDSFRATALKTLNTDNSSLSELFLDNVDLNGAQLTPFGECLKSLMVFFEGQYRSVYKFDYPPLHDPLAVAYVINPCIFKTKKYSVQIETNSQLCAGATIVDVWQLSGNPTNCCVCEDLDVEAFWRLMADATHQANMQSPLNHEMHNNE